MLDLIGAIAGMSTVGVNLVAFTSVLPGTLSRRLGHAAIGGGWVGLASGVAAAGALAVTPDQPAPLLGVLFAVPLLAAGAIAFGSPRARAALLAIPTHLLVALHAMRILGVLFLFLAAADRLGGPFPFFAALGDIATGAVAIPLALSLARGRASSTAVTSWNVFGSLDLLLAVTLGVTSANGSPIQLIHAGAGSEAMQHLPYSLVPTVLVPFYLITHGIIAAQLMERRASRSSTGNVDGLTSPTGVS